MDDSEFLAETRRVHQDALTAGLSKEQAHKAACEFGHRLRITLAQQSFAQKLAQKEKQK